MIVLSFPFSHIKSLFQRLLISLFQFFDIAIPHVFNLLLSYYTFLNKFLSIEMIDIFSFADNLIHHWLSKSWLILLIMSISSIPDYIDKNIFMEFLSVF